MESGDDDSDRDEFDAIFGENAAAREEVDNYDMAVDEIQVGDRPFPTFICRF